MKFDIIIVAILVLRFLVKLRFPANTSISVPRDLPHLYGHCGGAVYLIILFLMQLLKTFFTLKVETFFSKLNKLLLIYATIKLEKRSFQNSIFFVLQNLNIM